MIRIRIQYFRLNTDPDPGFWWPKFEKFAAGKKIKYFLIKNSNLPTPRPPLKTSKPQKKPSALKREHPALKNMKFFLCVCHFCPPRDSESRSGYGSTELIESRSEAYRYWRCMKSLVSVSKQTRTYLCHRHSCTVVIRIHLLDRILIQSGSGSGSETL